MEGFHYKFSSDYVAEGKNIEVYDFCLSSLQNQFIGSYFLGCYLLGNTVVENIPKTTNCCFPNYFRFEIHARCSNAASDSTTNTTRTNLASIINQPKEAGFIDMQNKGNWQIEEFQF